jgi:hypothetical protein
VNLNEEKVELIWTYEILYYLIMMEKIVYLDEEIINEVV